MNRYAISLTLFTLLATSSASAVELTTPKQHYSYTLGIQIGQMLRKQKVGEVDIDAFSAAVGDYLSDTPPRLTKEQMSEAMKYHVAQLQKKRELLKKENLVKGEAFRKTFGESKDVTTLESGLQYQILRAGEGDSPKARDSVVVHYHGTLIDGTVFDSTTKQGAPGKPTQFNLSGVIPGFRDAITRMKPGAKWKVVMPPEMAYGEKGAGRSIGPNETLIFEIELVKVVGSQAVK